ncbi:MAG: very short patch repair endonuclease, partial [Litorivicinaceae bacterium]|nr:very short patch repair endonuclease [Litorivicinaceae bacterium]
MVDIVNPETRSRMMANIRSKDTKPELTVRKHLHKMGFRFRLNYIVGSTKPDLVLPRWKTCVFVHGCYWHRHEGCKLASEPKSNTAFWKSKFNQNV